MKKVLLTLLLLCVAFSAQAEIVGQTSDGEYIHAYTADNGQVIYFTALEEAPFVEKADVNFDGALDLVACVGQGASNYFFEFYVWDGSRYAYAPHEGIGYGLCNYRLYPEKGLVLSHANNGFAGALHEVCLFKWEGTALQMIRRAVSDLDSEYIWYDDGYALRSYDNRLHVTVSGCTLSGEWETLLEENVSLADDSWYAREESALWQGL